MWLVFDPSRSSKVKSDCVNQKPKVAFKKVLPGVQPHIYHCFWDISNQRIVNLAINLSRSSKVKPMGSLYNCRWVQHRNSCRSLHISCQKIWPWFWPSRSSQVKSDGTNRKPRGPTCKFSRGPTSYLSLFLRYLESKDFDVDLWPLRVIQGQMWWCQSKAHRHFPIWPLLTPTPYLSPFGHKSPAWPPPNQRHSYNVCHNRSSMQYYELQAGSIKCGTEKRVNDLSYTTRTPSKTTIYHICESAQ